MEEKELYLWFTLNDQLFSIARARLKVTRIEKIEREKDKLVIYYLPEGAKSHVPDVKRFDIKEFIGG